MNGLVGRSMLSLVHSVTWLLSAYYILFRKSFFHVCSFLTFLVAHGTRTVHVLVLVHYITFHYITYVRKSNHNHPSALMTSARKGNTWVPLIDVPLSANLRRRFRSLTQSDSANNNRRARSFLPRPNVIFPHIYNHSLRCAFSSPCSLS